MAKEQPAAEGLRVALHAFALHLLVLFPALAAAQAFLVFSGGRGYWPRFLRIANPLVDGLNKWDSAWYLDIAYRGYNRRSAAFFPLYPWLMEALHGLTRLTLPVAGLVISNLALIGALYLLFRLVEEERGSAVARRAVVYLALFPTSVFFSATYTEALFLLLTLLAFWKARHRRWAEASLAAALAAVTRNLGVVLLACLALEYLEEMLRREGRFRLPQLTRLVNGETAWFLLIPAALGFHMFLLYRQFGEPLAFLAAQRFWQRSMALPTTTLWRGFLGRVPNWSRDHTLIDFAFAAAFLLLLIRGTRTLRRSEWLYFALGLLIPLSSLTPFAPLTSLPRYVAVLFPGFTVLATLTTNEEAHVAVSLFFATGLAVATILFSAWYWVA